MFSGIVAGMYRVCSIERTNSVQRFVIDLNCLTQHLEIGASVSVNGVCLTVVTLDDGLVSFQVIQATLNHTNLRFLSAGSLVNVERSLKLGDELGGHVLSGHIADVVEVVRMRETAQDSSIEFVVSELWRKYCHTKGFVALDGVSLTLASFNHESGIGVVNLIPETQKRTTLGSAITGTRLNLEVDPTTLAVVDTVERRLQAMRSVMDVPKDES